MVHFCLSRMWSFHAALDPARFRQSPGNFDLSGKDLGAIEVVGRSEAEPSGRLIARHRVYCAAERDGHDIHPALDLDADADLLSALQEWLLGEEEPVLAGVRLVFSKLRVTDYRFLNVIMAFEASNAQLAMLQKRTSAMTRRITHFVLSLQSALQDASSELGLLLDHEESFGLPRAQLPRIGLDPSDTYLYQAHLFVSAEDADHLPAIIAQAGATEPIVETPHGRVRGIWQTPVWEMPCAPKLDELPHLVEADNLLLAEQATCDTASQLYAATCKGMLGDRHRTWWRPRTRDEGQLGSSDLRRLSMRYALARHAVTLRGSALTEWQREYLRCGKQNTAIVEAFRSYAELEQLLSSLVEAVESGERELHTRRIETIAVFLTGLTLCSVYVDGFQFLHGEEPKQLVAARALQLAVVVALTTVATLMAFRRPR